MAAGNTRPHCTACSGPFSTSQWVAESPCPSQPLGQLLAPSPLPRMSEGTENLKELGLAGTRHPGAQRAISCLEGLAARGMKEYLRHITTLGHTITYLDPLHRCFQGCGYSGTNGPRTNAQIPWSWTPFETNQRCSCPQEEVTRRSPLITSCRVSSGYHMQDVSLCAGCYIPCSCPSALPGGPLGTTEKERRLHGWKRVETSGGVKNECTSWERWVQETLAPCLASLPFQCSLICRAED